MRGQPGFRVFYRPGPDGEPLQPEERAGASGERREC